MASSPPPPSYTNLPNPRKRPSISSSVSASAAKRRQLHPLRQTSFPATSVQSHAIDPSISQSARSETGSTFSATSSRVPGRGRGRPPKNKPTPASQDPDNASTTGKSRTGTGKAKSILSARSGAHRAHTPGDGLAGAASDNEDNEASDTEDEADEPVLNIDEVKREKEEDRSRAERERRLAGTLEGEAELRYGLYRSLKIDRVRVRRIINAVTSQSAADKVILAVQFTAKLYVGAIVEGAREVQREWAEAYDRTRKAERSWRGTELERLKAKKLKGGMTEQEGICCGRDIVRLQKQVEEQTYIPNPHRGGLLPDHLREALRRYRADGEAGGAAEQGSAHSLLGVPGGVAGRLGAGGGRRLFR